VRTLRRRLMPSFTLVLALAASLVAWLPLVIASQTPASAESTPVLDQRAEVQIGDDLASDGNGVVRQTSAPHFNALCSTDTGLWSQTITAGMTGQLVMIELLLLRRSPDITSTVDVELRRVDETGHPVETLLGRGSATTAIASHRSAPSWLTVPLDAPVLLRAGQKVAVLPVSTPSPSGACYEWISAGLDQYRGGAVAVTRNLGTTFFFDESGKDAAVRTWMR
jgi:hypothetical protein